MKTKTIEIYLHNSLLNNKMANTLYQFGGTSEAGSAATGKKKDTRYVTLRFSYSVAGND